ncbi:hypothetical protein PCO31110_01541 [Pandoraea communis]|uniref:Putative Flp pilus-assembly TadG-like N-terminal domain-containing protein n=2 Tax=Pandoraea communis TaxID=2508297 RepID=A0A5E4TNY6_9BURK|nr:hypothetical protein PCO31110_01541 [Pandoraea communis]
MILRARVRKSARMTPPGGRQRGSVPILSFIFLIVVLILAFALDAGNVFMQRRNLQRAADMAALAGAQTLPGCANATSFAAVASANAKANINSTALQVASSCGVWTSPAANATGPGTFVPVTSGNAASGNAVSVTLSMAVPSFFQLVGTRTVTATAIARKAPAVVTFTVDSGLLALNSSNSLLGPLLDALGLKTQDYILARQQLAGVTITPQGLLQALGVPVTGDISVGTINGVLAVQKLTVSKLLDVTKTALATQNGALSASVSLMNNLINVFNNGTGLKNGTGNALDLPVQLFGTATSPGVFANIDMPGVSTANALTANVAVADLITAAIFGGTGTSGFSIPISSPTLGVTANANVVSPPQIGIGGIDAQATAAQVRLMLNVSTSGSLLGGVLNGANTSLSLPLTIEVAQSTAKVTALQCGATPSATFEVTSGLVNVCVGTAPGVNMATNTASCTTLMTSPANIATLLGLVTVSANVNVSPVTNALSAVTISAPFPQSSPPLGSTLKLSQLVPALVSGLILSVGSNGASDSTTIANGLVSNVPASATSLTISTINSFLSNAAKGLKATAEGLEATLGGVLTLNGPQMANGVAALINGVLSTVGGLVTGLLGVLSDGVCNSFIFPDAVKSCRVGAVSGSIGTSNIAPILGSILYTLLNPLLTPLSDLLNSLVSSLGITLGMTTVTVDSINCQNGLVQLVY